MRRQAGLFERIVRFDNLLRAAGRAAWGKRDRPSVARFEFHLERELLTLQEELATGNYQPGAFFTFEIRDPKRRAICAAPFRDRVVHHAVCDVLEPVFERRLIGSSAAARGTTMPTTAARRTATGTTPATATRTSASASRVHASRPMDGVHGRRPGASGVSSPASPAPASAGRSSPGPRRPVA